MLTNRLMLECTVIPVLSYSDVAQAIDWLSQAFGFSLRLKIGDHRAQFAIGDGSIVITKERTAIARTKGSVMVRVERVDFLPESPYGAVRRVAMDGLRRTES